ncbi:MAG TPA: hypothetical protein VFQ25_04270 [Ktedonobacterales bacterium]|nr:hypothetical protein [Ktedonobacterales bacterium]
MYPSSLAFVDGWPALFAPAADDGLVALRGPLDGPLHTPARLAQQTAHVIGVVANAEGAPDHVRDALSRPHVAPKAIRLGAAGQQGRDLRPLLRRELAGAAGVRSAAQRLDPASPTGAPELLADGGAAHAQRGGDVLLPPALFVHLPGALAPPLARVGRSL